MTRRTLFLAVPAVLALVTAALTPTASAAPSPAGLAHRNVRVCSAPASGDAACHAIRNDTVTSNGRVITNTIPSGYGPGDLQSAYGLPSATSGAGQVVAIVDAYNDPNALSDVNTYRTQFFGTSNTTLQTCTGPSPTSSTIQPCFSKVNQKGQASSYPKNNGGWSQEISLDLDMVSAVCPKCSILLVEASSPTFSNLGTAVNTAATLRATEISNSYGGGESSSDLSYDANYFNHPGIAITASSGDGGYGVEYPAASQYVTAVGGTSLTRSTGSLRPWSETAWSGAGSGCSAYDPQPTWQNFLSLSGVCLNHRAVADVSAVADPHTGVAVYDSYIYQGVGGWLVFGGTSVASPLIASVYALAGTAALNYGSYPYGSYPYSHTSALNDVTIGSNGSCGTSVLCNAAAGWDGPTGLGTPKGLGGF